MRIARQWCGGVLALALGSAPLSARPGPDVRIDSGRLTGVEAGGVVSFKGIPFAAPPVGALRWRAPRPAARWSGVRDAVDDGHDCVQDYHPDVVPRGSEPAEDCLFANVWRPAGAQAGLPVMVWIYGGGFVNGAASRPIYSGVRLARRGIVVVSFNYRLGRFGTFAHPALTRANADGGLLGNYGYMDQIAALRWVRRNIAAFGGDPANVTVVGESAGAMSVHSLITSPGARGLFQRAVIASGGDGTPLVDRTMAEVEAIGAAFGRSQRIAPDDPAAAARLRALPADRVLGGIRLTSVMAPGPHDFSSPFSDGKVAVDAASAYRSGAFQHVPVMIGATSADMGGRHGMMIEGARTLASVIAAAGVPTYYYRFSYIADAARKPDTKGAGHAEDLPYYFETLDAKYRGRETPRDTAMAHTIATYLVNFVKTGNPNGASLPAWPAYRGPAGAMMSFGEDGHAIAGGDPWAGATGAGAQAAPRSADMLRSANGN